MKSGYLPLVLTMLLAAPWLLGADSSPDSQALRNLTESLDRLRSSPETVDSIVDRIDRETNETRAELEAAEQSIREIGEQIRQSEQRRRELQDRMDALATARRLLGVQDEATPAIAEAKVGFNEHIRQILSDKCFACHGPDEETRKAGLRLDDPKSAYAEGMSGYHAVVPGDREASELWRRINTHDAADRMPPMSQVKQLTAEEIERIGLWIDQGAEYETHWAFVKPVRPEIPSVSRSDWPKNPIDRFLLAGLEKEGIAPSPEADRRTLLRRVHLDLIGIPPTAREIEAFLSDESPDAYEKIVDRLLASPHFGERWGRYWLDAARYADSHGYSIDGPREIWKYRDWVIDAVNRDLPFDRFTLEQLAGDLLPESGIEQKIATGFHRNTMINQEGGIDKEEFRIEAVLDRVNTTGTVFLGLTVACVQCHEHKYDPIAHEEYYGLFAFFNDDDESTLTLPTEEQAARIRELDDQIRGVRQEWDAYLKEAFDGVQAEWEKNIKKEDITHLFLGDQAAFTTPREERTPEQQEIVTNLFRERDEKSREFKKRIDELNGQKPNVISTLVLEQRSEPRTTNLFLAGDFTRKGEEVRPGTISALHEFKPKNERPTRLDLAEWIVSTENPLTARVTVNRFWQRLFGKGIVETEDDFGSQGSLPTHPELLDWLAVEFVEGGWSRKAMLRLMTTSAAYRQSSHLREDLIDRDPNNDLLARQSRLRLDAEVIRDSALAAAGVLNRNIGGPGVFPPIPDGVMGLGQVKRDWVEDKGPNRFRRGMYTYFWRGNPHSFLMTFDAPNAVETCTRRIRSNTPLQSLTLLNDRAFVETAEELGGRLAHDIEGQTADKLAAAFEWTLSRPPLPEEAQVLEKLYENTDGDEREKWTRVARVLLNVDEFVTRE